MTNLSTNQRCSRTLQRFWSGLKNSEPHMSSVPWLSFLVGAHLSSGFLIVQPRNFQPLSLPSSVITLEVLTELRDSKLCRSCRAEPCDLSRWLAECRHVCEISLSARWLWKRGHQIHMSLRRLDNTVDLLFGSLEVRDDAGKCGCWGKTNTDGLCHQLIGPQTM